MPSLLENAMLVKLKVRRWQGGMVDKKITDEVAQRHQTKREAGHYFKRLIDTADMAELTRAEGEARRWLYAQTLPWTDDGVRIIMSDNYWTFMQEASRLKGRYDVVVQNFLAEYPRLLAKAKTELNGMFNRNDYPTEEKLASAFSFAVDVDPIPSSADFRVQMPDADRAQIQAEIDQRTAAAVKDAMKDVYMRLFDALDNLAGRLGKRDTKTSKKTATGRTKTPHIREAVTLHIQEICDLIPRLNLTGDENLENFRQIVLKKIACYDAESLRDDKELRQQVTQDAKDILADMAGYIGA